MVVKITESRNFTAKFDLVQCAFDKLLEIDFGVFGATQHNKYIADEQKLFMVLPHKTPLSLKE